MFPPLVGIRNADHAGEWVAIAEAASIATRFADFTIAVRSENSGYGSHPDRFYSGDCFRFSEFV